MRLSKISKFAQIVAFLILALAAFFWPQIEILIPSIQINQVASLVLAMLAAAIIYFDSRIEEIIRNPAGTVAMGSLGECLDNYIRDNSHIKHLRVRATSSEMIQPLIGARNVRIDKCDILVRLRESGGDIDFDNPYNNRVLHVLNEWHQLKRDGYIKELDIRFLDIVPLSYEVIFNHSALLLGKYYIREDVPAGVEYLPPFLISALSNASKEMIGTYVQSFDSTFSTAKIVPSVSDSVA